MNDILSYYSKTEISKYRTAYRYQKSCAKNHRGIPWNITFIEWLTVWHTSGFLHLRGKVRGCYQMSRVGDRGAYEVGNVFIQSQGDNIADCNGRRVTIRGITYRSINHAAKMLNVTRYHIYKEIDKNKLQ